MLSASGTRALQRALIAKGFAIPSGPTGWYGPETTKAVAAFQRSQGWGGRAADGIAGAETLRRLGISAGAATETAPAPTTRVSTPTGAGSTATGKTSAIPKGSGAYTPGTASREVYFLQQALIERGYAIPAGPTGYFGARTVDAVRAFQRDQGWPPAKCDGIPGSKTLALLGLS
jgi:peptidoglycan hydrolase-like protein with peptidoglycan-binding domain